MTQVNQFLLQCNTLVGNWNLSPTTTGTGNCFASWPSVEPDSISCDPFQLVWHNVPLDASCGGGTTTVRITF